jgi:general secretion pathway protein G
MNEMRLCRSQKGFSFVELMTSLAIMAVLVMMAAPMTQVLMQRHREHDLRMALIEIRGALDAYKRASEQGRILLKIGQSGYPPSLTTLVEGVVDQRSPTGQKLYFLRRLPADPLFEQGESNPELSWGLRSYVSPPDAPSPGADVFDVYSRSDKVGLNGVPYRSW